MADPPPRLPDRPDPPPAAHAPPASTAPHAPPAPPPRGQHVAITVNPERASFREQPEKTAENDRPDDQCYVRNSSFLSRDIEAQKAKAEPSRRVKIESPPVKVSPPPTKANKVTSPLKETSPPSKAVFLPSKVASPPSKVAVTSPPSKVASPPRHEPSPSRPVVSPPSNGVVTPPRREIISPPNRQVTSPPKTDISPLTRENTLSPKNEVTSPPASTLKFSRSNSKGEENPAPLKTVKKDSILVKGTILKSEKLSLVTSENLDTVVDKNLCNTECNKADADGSDKNMKNEESNGVGDKIKKFEKAAEDAGASAAPPAARVARAGSVRNRARPDDLPPPAAHYKDHVHFDLGTAAANTSPPAPVDRSAAAVQRQHSVTKNNSPNPALAKWQRSDSLEVDKVKPEPQKIIKPEFKPMPSPVDVTIRSPSLGAKIADQFPSHGTAFRNVASPDPARSAIHKINDEANTQNNIKMCKFKNKEKYSVSKGSSYFTRGSEEIWLVKKKDIEEIEERVLDSFRRAGGNVCLRGEAARPASEGGAGVFSHGTLGRGKRQMYARSESLDPAWAAHAHTLKRQSSVACTCGHDKKTRAKSATPAGPAPPAAGPTAGPTAATNDQPPPRPRSRSHGDENTQHHVLDKYETLV